MAYSKEVIAQLKSQTDIAAVVQQFLPLKRNGNNKYIGRCPFHDDHSPSMNVNADLGLYKCFACGAGGDVYKFIQEHEKLDFYGAVEWVANFSGFTLPRTKAENVEITEERELVRELNKLAVEWFEAELQKSEKAKSYLQKRNISLETQQKFRMGYAPESRDAFLNHAKEHGFSREDCVKAGLATVSEKNGNISDKFRDRLMIAIQNISGIVVGFGGRDLAPENGNFKRPKYMNSPDTALYSKSDILFGLNHSKNDIAKEKSAIIVEGYFDLISLYQSGIKNVVAASGTALTESHAKILCRYAQTAYLVFDGDAAGKKATERSIEIVLPEGITPRIFALSRPDGTKIDPDNYINENGAEAFKAELLKAEDWLDYLASESNLNSIETKVAFTTNAKSIIKSIRDKELQDLYLNMLAERYQTTRSLQGIQSAKPIKQQFEIPPTNAPIEVVQVPWHILSKVEIRFANLILRNPLLLDRASEFFDMEWAAYALPFFDSSLIDEFISTIIAIYQETGAFSQMTLYDRLPPVLQLFLENLPSEEWSTENSIKEFYETLLVLYLNFCHRYKKGINLSTTDGLEKRTQISAFIKNLNTLWDEYKRAKVSFENFIENILNFKNILYSFTN